MMTYDIVIIGAGPSGAMLARLLDKKYKVLILDKRNLLSDSSSNSYEKCCGGLLAPDAQKIIAQLGLSVPKDVMVSPQLFSVRSVNIKTSIERYYQRYYINLDREKFDRWVVSQIDNNVQQVFDSRFNHLDQQDDGMTKIVYTKDSKQHEVFSKIVVGADGANSKVRKLAFSNFKEPKKYISIQEWFKAKNTSSSFSVFFDEEVTDFYSWIIPKDDYYILGSALEYGDNSKDKFELLKTKIKNFGFNFNKPYKRNGAFIYRPIKLNQISCIEKNIALIGEAAGFISPSSAEGYSYAFKSALALANAINLSSYSFTSNYQKNVQSLKRNIFLKNLKSPFMYHPFLRENIMRSGISSMEMYKHNSYFS